MFFVLSLFTGFFLRMSQPERRLSLLASHKKLLLKHTWKVPWSDKIYGYREGSFAGFLLEFNKNLSVAFYLTDVGK